MIIFLGARKNEVLNLRWKDIDLKHSIARLQESKTGRRSLYINASAREILENLPHRKDNPYVIPGHKTGHCMVNIDKPWRSIRKLAGIEEVRLHDLRRSYGSLAVSYGTNLYTVSKLLGHSSIRVTQEAYAFMAQDPLVKASEEIGANLARQLNSRKFYKKE